MIKKYFLITGTFFATSIDQEENSQICINVPTQELRCVHLGASHFFRLQGIKVY